jgi:hypothetical protein
MKHFGEFRRHLWQARSIACLGARDRSWRRPARQSVRRPRPPLEDEWGAHEAPSPRATGPRTMFRSPAAACVRQRRSGIAPGAVVWENRRRFLAQFRRQATLPCVGRRAMGQNRPHGRLTCSLAPPPAITRKNQHWALGTGGSGLWAPLGTGNIAAEHWSKWPGTVRSDASPNSRCARRGLPGRRADRTGCPVCRGQHPEVAPLPPTFRSVAAQS